MRRAAIAALCLALAGCGFHPMYGGNLAPELSSIYVEPIAERDGYELRNTLIDLFDSSGRMSENFYRLHVTLSQKSQGVAVTNDAAITRYNDTLVVEYTLTNPKGEIITKGRESGLSAYNVVDSPYATLTAQQDSDTRAAQDIAYRIRTDLAVFFDREGKDAPLPR